MCMHPETRDSKYMPKEVIELKGKVDKSTVLRGDFNTPLSVVDRISSKLTRL